MTSHCFSDRTIKVLLIPVLLGIAIFSFFSCKRNPDDKSIRQEVNFNFEWKFCKDSLTDTLFKSDIDDEEWAPVLLPHTPNIEPLVVNDQWQGIAWYRKHFTIDRENRDKKFFIRFEGAMQVADVWINDTHKTTHYGGYLPFVVDITDEIQTGDNLVAVRLNNEENQQVPPGKPLSLLDFNTYGGLYRNVELIITDKLYITDPVLANRIAGGGLLISYDTVCDSKAVMNIRTHVRNEYLEDRDISVSQILVDANERAIASGETGSVQILPGADMELDVKIEITDPELWHPGHPYLYSLRTYLYGKDSKIVDMLENRIGIRKIDLQPDGFSINDEKFFINGTNRHQEYPYIGYALSDEAHYRDAVKIKNAGFDFVRLSHYPQSEAFLDACDELGLLVMNCIPGWQFMGDDTFRKNSLNDCRSLIRRDRNHPSVVFWEISLNETPMDEVFIIEANRILEEDLPDNSFSAGWIDHPVYDLYIPARQHARPPDYWNNYRLGERPVFIAEYGDWEYYAQNAGFNQISFLDLKPEERTSRQFRGDGEKRLLQQALNYQEAINSNRKGKSTIGHANWLMFDYNRGYADDIEASGISDIFRIPKFSYYLFKSQRPPVVLQIEGIESGPMVYIADYWQPGSSENVRIFSNCDEVALYVNGSLIERRKHDTDPVSTDMDFPPFTFSLHQNTTGTVKAIGYIDGDEVATHIVRTPLEPRAIELSFDVSGKPISKTGKDFVFVYAEIVDEHGTICPINGLAVEFFIEGNAIQIGGNPVASEAGIAAILLQTFPDSREIVITAKALNLQEGKLSVR